MRSKELLTGSMVALVTPFKNGKVDEEKLHELVHFHIQNGTDAIVPCGTSGESPTLSHEEHKRVIEIAVRAAKGKIPIIAGAGSNSTAEAVMLAQHAQKVGAAGALVIVPYYNKPTQEGMVEHFKAVAKSVSIPIILYNIPGRTGVNMLPETVAELSKVKNIRAIKESSGSVEQAGLILSLCDICVLSGDDALTVPLMSMGAKGVITVAANIVPKEIAQMVHAARNGDFETARKIHFKLSDLFKILFVQSNPIPVKAAMAMMGMIQDELRLPLVPLSAQYRPKLREVLERYDLLESHKNAVGSRR